MKTIKSNFIQRVYRQIFGPKPPTQILFWGLRRSGNHCIIDWLLSMHRLRHINQAKSPYIHNSLINTLIRGGNLISLEDKNFLKYKAHGKVQHILLLRDPFNLLASRIKRQRKGNPRLYSPKMNLWIQYAKEFCGETDYLANKICINYNQWFVSESYRREIAQQLNMNYSEETINRIPRFGRSSFDKKKYESNANEMAVLDRWRNQSNDRNQTFWECLGKNSEIFRLSKIIFPELPNDQIRAELDAQLSLTRNEI